MYGPMTSSPVRGGGQAGPDCGGLRAVRVRVEEELRQLAEAGNTQQLIAMLEEGAPFVIDLVSFQTRS